jgi:invasion protein IalB
MGPQPAGPAVQERSKHMVKSGSHYATVARIWRAGAVATALTLGVTGLSAVSYAQQQPAAKKAPEKAPAAAAKGAPEAPQSAWVKLCEAGQTVSKDKDGKEVKQDLKICMTMHERLDGNSGMTVVSAAVRKVEGQDKLFFMIMVPTEVVLKPGMRATFIPPDLWDKAVKGEQVDEKRLKEYRLDYTICHPGGCNAEIDASPELMASLKSSGGFMVTFLHIAGQRAIIPVALGGFDAAMNGNPVDNKAYTDARRQLMTQIAQRQREIFEEQKKQYEEQQKKGPPAAKDPPKK